MRIECSDCQGTGECKHCQGTGDDSKMNPHPSPFNSNSDTGEVKCAFCNGSGDCMDCDGYGSLRDE